MTLERFKTYALIGEVVDRLLAHGSWCGETHIQKAAYLAKEMLGVPLEAEFVLYKHGPYSFDLHNILSAMRAEMLLSIVPRQFGSTYRTTEGFQVVREICSSDIERFEKALDFVAEMFGEKNVTELERLSTAFFVTDRLSIESLEGRAKKMVELKPHVAQDAARVAVSQIDKAMHQWSLMGT